VTRQAAVLLGVPVLLAMAVAVPLGLWRGSYHWLCAAIALGLVLPPGLITLLGAERMKRRSPYGQVGALVLGTFGRLLIGFGGAVLVFVLSKPTFHGDAISFWMWVLGVYLTTLVVETVLLARANVPAGGVPGLRTGPDESV
jgi:hypothetical protein